MEKANKCTGCFACADVCPKHCISAAITDEGFHAPVVDSSLCIHCGRCDQACKMASSVGSNRIGQIFACQNLDESKLTRSSSGGIFVELAMHIIGNGGAVFGAAADQKLGIAHCMATDEESLSPLLGSKYVQSATIGIYRQVAEQLKKGRKVLFAGTPCQVAALYAVLGNKTENLYTVDFVCHGVPSPGVWKQYCFWLEKKFDKKLASVRFREKRPFGWTHFALAFSDDTQQPVFCEENQKNLFMQLFQQNKLLRASCYHCAHKKLAKHSDLTIADYWEGERFFPETAEQGISAVLVNSDKGKELFEEIRGNVLAKETTLKEFATVNRSLLFPAIRPFKRREILRTLMLNGFGDYAKDYLYAGRFEGFLARICRAIQKIGVMIILRKSGRN
ncbi:MAG: Coenzyme F420 hydrogenase/dehydrogenase, beta subunit C-terminal domain [Candidatus Limivicinus sp.]|nr:Coenzyme F420 hydrogenase/dehydrogenase, beta subunit C-terminal domain [Candidatus Limivicinus sp.]